MWIGLSDEAMESMAKEANKRKTQIEAMVRKGLNNSRNGMSLCSD